MENISVLLWYPFKHSYWIDILKRVEKKYGMKCRDKSDFGFEPDYCCQEDFDRVIESYYPDIIFLYNVTANNISVNIPKDIKVITYCDHFYEQFTLLGKAYFDNIPENNYLYVPILDADRIDRDNVLNNSYIKNKIFFAPFVSALEVKQFAENVSDIKKFACDLSVISSYKDVTYYFWCYGINPNSFQGRVLMQFICELAMSVRNKMKEEEGIYIEDDWLVGIIIKAFDKLDLKQYTNNKDEFIKIWFNALKFNVIPHEHMNCAVDWLIERQYNLKIYGSNWDKNDKYKKYACGVLEEGSEDLCKAYQYSKINIGTNITMGIHRRNIEVMENDCLCFQAYAGDEYIFSDYKHFFEDGKDIIIYRNKKELYDKIDFYLSHDDERRQVIKSGKNIVEKYLKPEDIFSNAIKIIYEK